MQVIPSSMSKNVVKCTNKYNTKKNWSNCFRWEWLDCNENDRHWFWESRPAQQTVWKQLLIADLSVHNFGFLDRRAEFRIGECYRGSVLKPIWSECHHFALIWIWFFWIQRATAVIGIGITRFRLMRIDRISQLYHNKQGPQKNTIKFY